MDNVSIVRGLVRYDNIFRSLKLLSRELGDRISSSSRIVVKPGLLHLKGCPKSQHTHVDSVKATLDFVQQFTNKKITIAEGSFSEENVFHNHGYHDLARSYPVRFLNLNRDDSVPVQIGNAMTCVSKTLLRADFRISVSAPVRTRQGYLFGSVPNVVLGSITGTSKEAFRKRKSPGSDVAELFKLMRSHLSVLDGFNTLSGLPGLKSPLAIAGRNGIAVDTALARMLKIKAPYLNHLEKPHVKLVRKKF